MAKTVLILHGIGGHAGIHWQQWLHDELAGAGYSAIMPELPGANNPDRTTWLGVVGSAVQGIDVSSLIIVGHSLGVTAALDFIEQSSEQIEGLVSVAGFAEDYGAELNGAYLRQKFIDLQKVKNNLTWAEVFLGDNDPYVAQGALRDVAVGLGVEPVVISNGGHLNTDTGFTKFPQLLEIIKSRSPTQQ